MQEKLSLAARFGLRLTFPSPDQKRYLEIVMGLAADRDLKVRPDELREKALLWDRWHAGRSGRTARQFVDEFEAEVSESRLEAARIGSLLFIFADSPSDLIGFSSTIGTFAIRLSAQPLREDRRWLFGVVASPSVETGGWDQRLEEQLPLADVLGRSGHVNRFSLSVP